MVLKYFPSGAKPSTTQSSAIKQIFNAFNTTKFVVVQGPTGCGKSYIGKTLANSTSKLPDNLINLVKDYTAYKMTMSRGKFVYEYADDFSSKRYGASILTTTKSLQDQYTRDFDDIAPLKGKSNYVCNLDGRSTAEAAPCNVSKNLKKDCWDCNRCDYYESRNRSITSKISIENYSSFFHKPNHLKNRDLIICDEASELENVIVSRFSCNIELGRLFKYGFTLKHTSDRSRFYKKLINFNIDIDNRITELQSIIDKHYDTMSSADKGEYRFLTNTREDIARVIDTWHDSDYLFEEKYIKNKKYLRLVPLKVDNLAQHLFKYANKVLLMSATFVDVKATMRSLGIQEQDYTYINVDSEFDPTLSPIFVDNFSLSKGNLTRVFNKLVKRIEMLLDLHKDEKGLIHTQSDVITTMLREKLGDSRLLYRIQGHKDNIEILNEHMTTNRPTVLASPSMNFGVDLKGDAARFCIVVKLPWLDLGDMRISAMNNLVPGWYEQKMLTTLIQQCGRCTRDKNDHSKTYILDGWVLKDEKRSIIRKHYKLLPKYFVDRIF